MNTLFIPLHWIRDTINSTQSNPPASWQNKVLDWTPSECCGAAFVEANNVINKGITIWLSDKAEDCFTDDYIIESVKLVNGDYMHFKINLVTEEAQSEPEEDEEW